MRVLVTGSQGFIGKNLVVRLGEVPGYEVVCFDRGDAPSSLAPKVRQADAVVHLAGENRPKDEADFEKGNAALTRAICDAIQASGRKVPLVFASSLQAKLSNPYGLSKRSGEKAVEELAARTGNPSVIYRLPGVFGKWCKPNYNSVVATFCYNTACGLPLQINDSSARLRLVYVDDVVSEFLLALGPAADGVRWGEVASEYAITLGELAAQIEAFRMSRTTLFSERVGSGFLRALYAAYEIGRAHV